MKKNLLYTLCILLSGSMFFSSCEDMLEVDSSRVDHDFDNLVFSDSVYSVLGILKQVQNVADRYVVLGEVRGDLVVPTSKAVVDLQEISKFEYNAENPYLAAKDFYAIVNNCNVFLARVDTTLESSNDRLMLREFVAVKSLRAWAYMQLAINYNNIPYYTKPILSRDDAAEVLSQPMKTREEVMSLLIEDLTPYENPIVYRMPSWKGVKTGDGKNIITDALFMPIRMLLGELHLWRAGRGDYTRAALYFHSMLSASTPWGNARRYFLDNAIGGDYSNRTTMTFNNEEADNIGGNYQALFSSDNLGENGNALFAVPMQTSTFQGTVSQLSEIFAPRVSDAAQVNASAGYVSLSNRQVYCMHDDEKKQYGYNPNTDEFVGDLRRYVVTGNKLDGETGTYYGNVIGKFNLTGSSNHNGVRLITTGQHTTSVQFARGEHIFARFAEALYGMARYENAYIKGQEHYNSVDSMNYYEVEPAIELAMHVLKGGLTPDENCVVLLNPEFVDVVTDTTTNETVKMVPDMAYEHEIEFSFPAVPVYNSNGVVGSELENTGLHSRGSGNSEKNLYYAYNDTCVARYYGLVAELSDSLFTTTREITDDDRYNYVRDLLIDELALEFCFEGNRFGDLIRFAKSAEKNGEADWRDILAKRVAARTVETDIPVSNVEFVLDGEAYQLYNKLQNESFWYLPLTSKDIVSEEQE